MKKLLFSFFLILFAFGFHAQEKKSLQSLTQDIKFRNIGPALMSGRIADIALHPEDPAVWYVAVGSGGVWKTETAGTTWKPVFDGQKSFSIGCVTVDPNNPHTVWVGTGENVGGRHVSFGDGIYVSYDDGKTWKNMGLKKSEHISEIIVHPQNSDIIYVAVQGPLWSPGGERGFYKSTDGGKTWKKTLGDDRWTGVTDIAIDPRNPDRIYAATWERHRTIANYMGGGKNSAIYRSEDGGETWKKIMKGISSEKNGKIGIAVSPVKPDVIYAAVEHNRRKGAVYKSTDRGENWVKQSNTVSGATGPHYYQELWASPHKFDRIYLANVQLLISDNGGKDFRALNERDKFKHVDNHVLVFRKDTPGYMLAGTDGGIYESFDDGETWRFINNLPVTQFYKLALDDSKPFYYIYGGTQDNNTQRGPSQTDNVHGIANRDWQIVLHADGHQPATEPGNPDIVYAQWQQGNLTRIDMRTGEITYIQPQPGEGEPYERFNWDAPVLVSPHSPTRLYVGSYRLWRSDNRGDDWTPVSGDLTRSEERFDMPIMGRKQSWDSPWDVYAMSNFNTITSISESPVQEGLIYVGTDDGLLQVTENGGKNWRRIDVSKLPGAPARAYVNDIKADLFNKNTVYVCLDNHKTGDYTPYVYKSTDRGKTWKSIAGNLKAPLIVWRFAQDYQNPDLMFLGTEFGIYATVNGGKKWFKLNTGANISFRDIAIKKGEDDLVGASFGRGFFILDDYSFLREAGENMLKKEAGLFRPKDSWWYIPRPVVGFNEKGTQGASYFVAPNPPYGTTFTYYVRDTYKSLTKQRREKEKPLENKGEDIDFPGWEKLDEEVKEVKPQMYIEIIDRNGEAVNRVPVKMTKGFHRATWDHTRFTKSIYNNKEYYIKGKGVKVMPGTYRAYMMKIEPSGEHRILTDTVSFEVKRLKKGSLSGRPDEEVNEFLNKVDDMRARVSQLRTKFEKFSRAYKTLEQAYTQAKKPDANLLKNLRETNQSLVKLEKRMFGSPSKNEVGEAVHPTIFSRMNKLQMNILMTTYGPTGTDLKIYRIVEKEYQALDSELNTLRDKLIGIQDAMKRLEIPYIDTGLCKQ